MAITRYHRWGTDSGGSLGEGELGYVEVAGAKARLAVGQVQRPHPAEGLVEAELADLSGALLEARPPTVQGLGIVPAEVEPVRDVQRCAPPQ